ncbi:MAG: DNA-3-methyladenine glycosylase [Desulfurococcales archaeon]|nr:DNA-3-methyladenine glycosylase [Desulfurococcales archaeon]
MGLLPRSFYERDPALVAAGLLGAILRRDRRGPPASCRIVETEAYYGPSDPASRAARTTRGRIAARLRGPPGVALVYGIHRQWLLNIVAHPEPGWGAVLIRACEPLEGLPGDARTSGPGLLTRALGIDKSLDGVPVYEPGSPLRVEAPLEPPPPGSVGRGRRIGVSRDLPVPLRFCLAGSRHLSRPCRPP